MSKYKAPLKKTVVPIKGMHCRSCEILVEDELLKIPGVNKAIVSQSKGCAEIYHSNGLDEERVNEAVKEAGYTIGKDENPWFSRDINEYGDLFVAAGILVLLYFLADYLGVFNLVNLTSNNFSSLPVVFLVGITAGLSTCMALVGGLVLGASAKFAEKHPNATSLEKFKPHLFFNLGRIASYFVLGGVIGALGSVLQLSTSFLGSLTLIVGFVMLLLGIQLTEISPRLRKINITMPKSISRFLGIKEKNEEEYTNKNAMVLGALTFFLPCGFTQAMQLYAMSSGSALTGALTMGIFALGTAPGLLGIGSLTSLVKGEFAKSFFKFAGLVVITLALFNISNGYNLTGFNFSLVASSKTTSEVTDPNVTLENGVQVVRMTETYSGYSPNTFTIKKGVPVKWIVDAKDVNTCASTIVSSKLGIKKGLTLGENVFEFTPNEEGQIKFSCIMGMYTGVFNVVGDGGSVQNNNRQPSGAQPSAPSNLAAGGGSCGSGGCGCGGGAAAQKKLQATASVTPVPPTKQGDVQVLKTTYTQDNDIQPNKFTVKVGQPVRMEIDVKDDGYGCMGSITIPGLVSKVELLTKGQPITFEFTPQKSGNFNITCAMGIPRGTIIVN